MKTYPSIPSSVGASFREFKAHVWDKLDGSNLRMEWSRKQGFHKYGTRTRLFDESDLVFGPSISLFEDTLAAPCSDICRGFRADTVTIFCEFWGANSFAGNHEDEDKQLSIIDVAVYKRGWVSPKEFRKLFGHLSTPKYLGQVNWTRQYVQDVRDGKIEGVTLEGVVGKSQSKTHDRITAKAKSQAWVDKVKASYSPEEAQQIIKS